MFGMDVDKIFEDGLKNWTPPKSITNKPIWKKIIKKM